MLSLSLSVQADGVPQGIATVQGRTETAEKLDVKMALHYFGRVDFVRELGPALDKSLDGGKVMVSSHSAILHSTH
jgi:hypothetical protein